MTLKKMMTDVLFNKQYIKIFLLLLLIFGLYYFVIIYKKPYCYFPCYRNIDITFYDDLVDKGNSRVNYFIKTENYAEINFTLQEGFIKPYVGLRIPISNVLGIDISQYDRVELELKGKRIKNVSVYIVINSDSLNKKNVRFKELYFTDKLVISDSMQRYILPVKHFTIPEWWFDANNISPPIFSALPSLKGIHSINIASGHALIDNYDKSIILYRIVFSKNNLKPFIKLIFVYLIVLFSSLLFMILRFYIKQSNTKIVFYKPVAIDNKSRNNNDFWNYLNENFLDDHLTLEKVSKATGINARTISAQINERFGCNFKTYINSIRIAEAQRLLNTQKYTNSEIAFMLGFNSLSHFDRVFKKITGLSPSDYSARHNNN